jgi:hypothetical protein
MLERKCATKKPEFWRNHNWLHQDNVPANMSLKTTESVTNNYMVIMVLYRKCENVKSV